MKLLANEEQKYKLIVNIAVLALSLYSLSQREQGLQRTSAYEDFLIDAIAPLQETVTSTQRGVQNLVNDYLLNINASKENIGLKRDISDLNDQIFRLQQLDKENQRLKQLLQFGTEVPMKRILAQIVAWDATSDFKMIRVNKGHRDGVRLQSVVVTSDGVVGYVYRVSDHYADILTILDTTMRVDAMIERLRVHGILEGLGSNRGMIKYVTRTDPVVLSDLVITSGFGNIFPKGLKLGHVTRIERESYGITQYIEVEPSVNFTNLEEVVILVNEFSEERNVEWQTLNNEIPGQQAAK
jgi:rod shape-determining protein MreC